MKENTDEKSLVKINENSIFYKIKQFFKKLFYKKETINNITVETNKVILQNDNKKNKFMEEIKNMIIEEDKNQLGLIEYLGIGIGENRND